MATFERSLDEVSGFEDSLAAGVCRDMACVMESATENVSVAEVQLF